MNTTDEVTWLRERVEAMTPGERWESETGRAGVTLWGHDRIGRIGVAQVRTPEDAAGVAALRNLAPSMLAVIEAAQRVEDNRKFRKTDPDAFWMEYAAMLEALDAFRSAVREEQSR